MEAATLLLNEPSLLIDNNKDLACLICNTATSLQTSYSIFYTVLANKGTLLCNSVQKVIKRLIEPDGIRSTVLCSRCFSLFDELEVCEERCVQLRQSIISWFNASCQIYGDLDTLVVDGIACQTDPINEEIDLPSAAVSAPSLVADEAGSVHSSDAESDNPDPVCNEPEYIEDPRNIQVRSKMIGPLSKEATSRLRRYRHHCEHCDRMFRRPSELKKHILSHFGAKPFGCNKCDKRFVSKQGATFHLLRSHGAEAVADAAAIKDETAVFEEAVSNGPAENPEQFVQAVIKNENSVPIEKDLIGEFDGSVETSDVFPSAPVDYDDDFEWKEDGLTMPQIADTQDIQPELPSTYENVSEVESQHPILKPEKRGRKPKKKSSVDSLNEDSCSSVKEDEGEIMDEEDEEKKEKPKRVRKRGNRTSERYSMPPIHECDQCGKKWRTISELKSHIASHSELRPFVCEICGQAYKMRKALDVHVGMHNGIHPYTCHICNKSFTQKVGLQKHLPIHTGYTRFQCDLCGKRFIHHKSFNIHKMTHTGEKTIKCTICGLAVLSQSHLKRHYRVHTGERPYACEICGKRFAEKYNLNAHGRVHDPESSLETSRKKVHCCQLCGASYDRKHKLEDHLASSHNKLPEDRSAPSNLLGDLPSLIQFNRGFPN